MAESEPPAADPGAHPTVGQSPRSDSAALDDRPAGFAQDTRQLAALLGAIVAPITLITALAYYFGWRRERAFAGYFGIDPSVLALSNDDYVLRSVNALFAPFAGLLLVAFALLCARLLLAGRTPPRWLSPLAATAGVAALAIGLALAVGHGVSSDYIYAQAFAPAVGALLIAYALTQLIGTRAGPERAGLRWLHYLTISVVLVSLFWATAEYADSRGTRAAQTLAGNFAVAPSVTIFSKANLDIDPSNYGTDASCLPVTVERRPRTDYPFIYRGFTLLVRNGGSYFVTPTPPAGVWEPVREPVLIIADNDTIRVELERGADYPVKPLEQTISGGLPAFTC